MSSPRKGLRSQTSRSRFHEGSMNDRVSAVPPVQFLGPEEREMLGRPIEVEHQQHQLQRAQTHTQSQALAQMDTYTQIHSQGQGQGQMQAQVQATTTSTQPHHQKQGSIGKKGGNLLGQVWEGVREKLKLRRDIGSTVDDAPMIASATTTSSTATISTTTTTTTTTTMSTAAAVTAAKKRVTAGPEMKRIEMDRPTRDETLANYHHLMATGFFSQHAIQSTRHARPNYSRPSSSRSSTALSRMRTPQQPNYAPPPPPQWSFSTNQRSAGPPLTPSAKKPCTPFVTPTSASSRGTKRAAADEEEIKIHVDAQDDDEGDNECHDRAKVKDGDQAAAAPVRCPTPHAKVRKIASGNFASLPLPLPLPLHQHQHQSQSPSPSQLPAARGKLLIARRISSSSSMRSGSLPPIVVQKKEPSLKLTKRAQRPAAPAPALATTPTPSPARGSLEVLSERMYSTVRRNVSENYYSVRAVGSGSMTARVLRPKKSAQGLSVMPDANRGIPRVPHIPSKYGACRDQDDGENQQLWRTLGR